MFKDFTGTEITEGATIIYAGRKGSSLWLTKAKVTHLGTRERWDGDPAPEPCVTVQPEPEPKFVASIGRNELVERKPVQLVKFDTICVIS